MKNEERDSYLIPPNFIEGGTLMGGLFKTRNVIEAGVLGALTGIPVFRLPLSLTARIILLCLTALPLVLIALIGVGGSSLSGFILQFFKYLHNRRILSKDGKCKKPLLPSWGRSGNKVIVEEEPDSEDQHKSKNRVQVDIKERKVNQFKTFLPPPVKPLNPLADYIPVEKIQNGVICTKDHRYVKVVEVIPVNFLLRTAWYYSCKISK